MRYINKRGNVVEVHRVAFGAPFYLWENRKTRGWMACSYDFPTREDAEKELHRRAKRYGWTEDKP